MGKKANGKIAFITALLLAGCSSPMTEESNTNLGVNVENTVPNETTVIYVEDWFDNIKISDMDGNFIMDANKDVCRIRTNLINSLIIELPKIDKVLIETTSTRNAIIDGKNTSYEITMNGSLNVVDSANYKLLTPIGRPFVDERFTEYFPIEE